MTTASRTYVSRLQADSSGLVAQEADFGGLCNAGGNDGVCWAHSRLIRQLVLRISDSALIHRVTSLLVMHVRQMRLTAMLLSTVAVVQSV